MKDGTSQVIGSFPKVFWGGWPSIFSVSDGILWASFPVKGVLSPHPNSGEVYKMDMASGKVTMHKKFKSNVGQPYFIAASQGDKTTGVFAKQAGGGKFQLTFCNVDLSGSDGEVTDCKPDASWWGWGRPLIQCGSDPLYYFASDGRATDKYEPILGADMKSGELTDSFHLDYAYKAGAQFYVGAMACSGINTDTIAV